jgi:hypothetical protein
MQIRLVHCGSNQWFKSRDSARRILNRWSNIEEWAVVDEIFVSWTSQQPVNMKLVWNGLKIGAAKSVHPSYLDDPTFMLESHFWRGKTGVYLRWLTTIPMRVLCAVHIQWVPLAVSPDIFETVALEVISIIFAELNAQLLLFGCVWNPEMTITIRKLMI